MRPFGTSRGTVPHTGPQGGSIIQPEETKFVILTNMLPPDFLLVQIGERGQILTGIGIPILNKNWLAVNLDTTLLPVDDYFVWLCVLFFQSLFGAY